ncbi:MAG: phage baseplate assembly protein V, partial [Holophagales bacterium]|nr:phage baseplate assembly protein V [Holophagales bacterium]
MTALHPLTELLDPRLARGWGGRFYGVYAAVVTDIVDPDAQARVRVRLPWSAYFFFNDPATTEIWARLATLMAGSGRGTYFVPEVDDEVL